MKHILLYLLLATTIVTDGSPFLFGGNVNQTPIIITITGDDEVGEGLRSPNAAPFNGYVIGSDIFIVFPQDMGEVAVDLSELSEGAIFSVSIDSAEVIHCLPFGGNQGTYTLVFTLEDSSCYTGHFEVL